MSGVEVAEGRSNVDPEVVPFQAVEFHIGMVKIELSSKEAAEMLTGKNLFAWWTN